MSEHINILFFSQAEKKTIKKQLVDKYSLELFKTKMSMDLLIFLSIKISESLNDAIL